MRKNRNILLCRLLSSILICVLTFSCYKDIHIAKASEDDWIDIVGGENGSQDTRKRDDTIIQTGRHNSADDDAIRYKTLYFRMTSEKYKLDQRFSEGNNANVKYEYVPFEFGDQSDDGTTKTVEYIIQRDKFLNAAAAANIGVTGDYLVEHGSATVYLNNVFQIFQGDKTLYKQVYGYQDMLEKEPWSSSTKNYLYGYYNFKYVLSGEIVFKVKVIVVDTDNNVLNDDLLGYTKNAIYNEVIPPYTLNSDTIKKNNVTYEYQYWKYVYKDRKSEDNKTLGNFTGKTVSFNAPDAFPGSTLTIKMVFKKKDAKPSPTPKPGVSVTPKPSPSATPKPTPPPVEIPKAADPIELSTDIPSPVGVINGDRYGSPYFTSAKGISTTESQYVYVKTKDYLLGYSLVNKTGKMSYSVRVTKNYTLQYMTATPIKDGGPKPVTATESRSQVINVERAYSYWEIDHLDYYYADTARVYNYSLPSGSVSLTGNRSYLNIPSLSTWHSNSLLAHVMPPEQVDTGITVDGGTISTTSSDKPTIPYEDFSSYALSGTSEARVKNDSIVFNGNVVMSDSITRKIAPSPNVASFIQCSGNCHDKGLFTQDKIIDAEKENRNYSSTGNVSYSLHSASVNNFTSSKSFDVPVNKVIIHTPVICKPVVTCDNDKWTQLINPKPGAVQVVLDPDSTLNDFTVSISNTLEHSDRPGYHLRDFSRSFINSENVSYIAKKDGLVRNEIRFPFDVYVDLLGDGLTGNDIFLKSGTWYILGRETHKFFVPMWVQEGEYTVDFRCVAVNGIGKLDKTEGTRNSNINNYVSTSTMAFEVSGRIYGLTLYDISDYPIWENVFRKGNTMHLKYFDGVTDGTKMNHFNEAYAYYYTVGTKDQYGKDTERLSKYTFPLVNGSHPKYKNLGVLKTGYAVRFMLDTTGDMYGGLSHIKIIPSFYYVDAAGKNRKQVELYYYEEINGKAYSVVKIGAGIDLVNIKTGSTGNIYNRIPEGELRNTAAVLGTTYAKVVYQNSPMYSYSQFKLFNAFRTFIGTGYSAKITGAKSYDEVKEAIGLSGVGLTKFVQRWYGNYKIPTKVHAVPSGYDVRSYMRNHGLDYSESFWLKDGYIIVNFNIITIDKNGKERLSYINGNNYLNNGNCSMWVTEGAIVQKTDHKGTQFTFKAGDYLIYYNGKNYNDDYEGVLY